MFGFRVEMIIDMNIEIACKDEFVRGCRYACEERRELI